MDKAKLDELARLLEALPKGDWRYTISKAGRHQISATGGTNVCMMWSTFEYPAKEAGPALCAIHNAFPAILEYVRGLEIELQGWRHERAMTLTAFAHVRDGGDPALIGHPNGSVFGDALRDMLAQQRREGAAEELERLAGADMELRSMFLSENEMGLRAFSHAKLADDLRQAAKRLREAK